MKEVVALLDKLETAEKVGLGFAVILSAWAGTWAYQKMEEWFVAGCPFPF